MKFSRVVLSLMTIGLVATSATQADAQLPGLGGSSSSAAATERAQAATQQRAQAQIQQRTQARVQQQVQAQTTARLQASAARAANIAQRTNAIVQRQAAAVKGRVNSGVGVRVDASANARSRTQTGNQSVDLATAARLGVDTRLSLPADMTEADVKIYDEFFGRFNPLRPQPIQQTSTNSTQSSAESAGSSETTSQNESQLAGNSSAGASQQIDLSGRIKVAARQRRAEISEMRDRALATGDAQLMIQAERVEAAMNAFVAAQARTRSAIGAEANNAQRSGVRTASSANASGSARATSTSGANGNKQGPRSESGSRANSNSNAKTTGNSSFDR